MTPYEQHKPYVLGVLARRCGWIDKGDREAAYHDAYLLMLEKQAAGELEMAAMHSRQVRAYLTEAAIHKGLAQRKRAESRRTVPLGEAALNRPDPRASPEERAAAAAASAVLRELIQELPERRRAVIKLRFYLELSPEEIQRFLAISDRAYRKEIERGFRQLAERYELVREGRLCEARKSVVLAYVAGLAGPGKVAQARMHLGSCRRCAQMAGELREAVRSAAAAIALPDVVAREGILARGGEAAAGAREHLSDAAAILKQHAFGAATKLDLTAPQYLVGARPGTAATILAGCIAVGGGAASYCSVEGLPDPLRPAVAGIDQDRPARHQHRQRQAKIAPSPPPAAAKPQMRAPLPPPKPTPPPPPAAARQSEFEPTPAAPASAGGAPPPIARGQSGGASPDTSSSSREFAP